MKAADKKSLVKRYTEIRDQLIKTLEKSDYEVDIAGDVVDQLQGQHLVHVQNSISVNNIMKLRAIDFALESIARGDYGNCDECGEPIGLKRLEALPGVTTCILCAELYEQNR